MTAALQGLEGVERVQVTLAKKLAAVTFKTDNSLKLDDLRGAVRKAGYRPADATLELSGAFTRLSPDPGLEVARTKQVYRLADGADAEGKPLTGIVDRLAREAASQKGKVLIVSGLHEDAPEPKEDEKPQPPVLRVTAYRFEAPPAGQ